VICFFGNDPLRAAALASQRALAPGGVFVAIEPIQQSRASYPLDPRRGPHPWDDSTVSRFRTRRAVLSLPRPDTRFRSRYSTAGAFAHVGCALPRSSHNQEDRGLIRSAPVGRPPARLKRGDPSPGSSPTGGRSAGVNQVAPREASQPAPLPRNCDHSPPRNPQLHGSTPTRETTPREQQASLPSRGHGARTFPGAGARASVSVMAADYSVFHYEESPHPSLDVSLTWPRLQLAAF